MSDTFGIDERSAWYDDYASAKKALDEIGSRRTCYVCKNNLKHAVLLNKLPSKRKLHYIASSIGGCVCVLLASVGMVLS